jgi:cAMP phosphodiesterase
MNKFVILACVGGAAFLLYDLQSVKQAVNEALRWGTLKGVETCVAHSKSDLVSAETTRNVCIESFQRVLYNRDLATGRAGPKVAAGGVNLDGFLENKTSGFVTTWVKVAFELYDASGETREFQADTYIWIEPRSSTDFSVALPDLEPDEVQSVEFCDHDDTLPKSCMTWGIVEIKGIEI